MPWVIFQEVLRRHWRVALYWGLGLGFLAYITAIMIRDDKMLKQFADLVRTLPPALLKMFGGMDAVVMTTPEGFLATAIFTRTLLLMTIYAVISGMNISANEEEQGILDVVLSLPVPRWRVLVEKYLVYALGSVIIVACVGAGIFLGMTNAVVPINTSKVSEALIGLLPGAWFTLALTAFCGAWFRSRGVALGVASGLVVVSYFIDSIGQLVEGWLNSIRLLSFFSYYSPSDVIFNGLNIGYFAFITLLALVLVIASTLCFQRRDIGV